MIFKTFEARIVADSMVEGAQPIDRIITFSRSKIFLKESQINRIYLDPMMVRLLGNKDEYDFDKLMDKDDKRQFSIILRKRLNVLDDGIFYLNISRWNKVKANLIHHRYWLYREREWFVKTLIATIIGAGFGIMGAYLGYRLGFQNGTKAITTPSQVQAQPPKR